MFEEHLSLYIKLFKGESLRLYKPTPPPPPTSEEFTKLLDPASEI